MIPNPVPDFGPEVSGSIKRPVCKHTDKRPTSLTCKNVGRCWCPEGELSVIPTTPKTAIPRIFGGFKLAG